MDKRKTRKAYKQLGTFGLYELEGDFDSAIKFLTDKKKYYEDKYKEFDKNFSLSVDSDFDGNDEIEILGVTEVDIQDEKINFLKKNIKSFEDRLAKEKKALAKLEGK